MKYLKTTWDDVRNAERRPHTRTAVHIICPFCGFKTGYFPGSLAGTGKRCALCGALHTQKGWSIRKRR